jgi:hypothetical protein
LIRSGFILAEALGGFYFGNLLPERHVSSESTDAVKMGWGQAGLKLHDERTARQPQ